MVNITGEILSKSDDYRMPYSVVHYFPMGVEVPVRSRNILISLDDRRNQEAQYQKLCESVLLPMSVNPLMFIDANVKGYVDKYEGVDVYILEILKDESIGEDERFTAAALGSSLGSRYEGFRYMVEL